MTLRGWTFANTPTTQRPSLREGHHHGKSHTHDCGVSAPNRQIRPRATTHTRASRLTSCSLVQPKGRTAIYLPPADSTSARRRNLLHCCPWPVICRPAEGLHTRRFVSGEMDGCHPWCDALGRWAARRHLCHYWKGSPIAGWWTGLFRWRAAQWSLFHLVQPGDCRGRCVDCYSRGYNSPVRQTSTYR
jgi:hypothetical protein